MVPIPNGGLSRSGRYEPFDVVNDIAEKSFFFYMPFYRCYFLPLLVFSSTSNFQKVLLRTIPTLWAE